jgi:hypothetical protein
MHRVLALSELRTAFAPAYLADVGTNWEQAWAISAAKNYPLSRPSGLESDPARDTKVQPNALQRRWTGNGSPTHLDSDCSSSFSSRRIIPANLNNAAEARRDSLCGRAG